MAYAATWSDYSNRYFEQDAKTFDYNEWDSRKIRGCVCDALYGDVDCSSRMCPYGTDVLDTRDDLLISTKYQVQELTFVADDLSQGDLSFRGGYNSDYRQVKTFALTFKSRLNETFTTMPIVMNPLNLPKLSNDIMLALLQLPNRVIDGVMVYSNRSVTNGLPVPKQVGTTGYLYHAIVNSFVTFTGPSVQGPQHMLSVQGAYVLTLFFTFFVFDIIKYVYMYIKPIYFIVCIIFNHPTPLHSVSHHTTLYNTPPVSPLTDSLHYTPTHYNL